jgi:hypothetical protein
MRFMKPKICWPVLGLAVGLALGNLATAQAQTATDPTRPPDAWLALQPQVAGGTVVTDSVAPGVQIIVTGPARKFAIIDGQLVRYGVAHNGAKLVGIRPESVVLQKDGNRETLSMSPAVVKNINVSKPVPRKPKRGQKVVNGEGQ